MTTHGRTHWIKLYVEMLDDPKVGLLPDAVKWRWVSSLLLAGELNEDGFLPDINDAAWRLHTNVETLQGEMRTLAGRGLVELREHPGGGERWFIPAFAKRQEALTSTDRSRNLRQRRRQNGDETAMQRNVAKKSLNTETETETEVGTASAAEGIPTDLPTDFPEFLTPAQVAAIVDDRQKLNDPVVILEDYIAGRISGKPDSRKSEYDRDWRMPILQMITLTDGDTALAKTLIDAALIEARKPKVKDGQPYRIVRPHGLLPFFQTQLDNHRAAVATTDDDSLWQRAIAAVKRREFTDERLRAAVHAIGGSSRIASANGRDADALKRSLGHAYRNVAAA